MNNAVYYEYVDATVNAWLIREGGLRVPDGPVVALAAESGCVYFASLGFPEPVETGLGLFRLGRSSISWRVGLFAPGEAAAAAEARFVHVCVDRDSRRPVPVPESLRAALAALGPPLEPG